MASHQLRMKGKGMTCDHCEVSVTKALEGAGACEATADFRREEAVSTVEEAVDEAKVAAALQAGDRAGAIEVLEAEQTSGAGRVARPEKALCPNCREAGKSVDSITLKALLAVPLTELRAVEYRFCRTADCPTVYYSVDGEQQFGEEALREQVHQKHPTADDVFVCYCFRHSPSTIRAELVETGRSTTVVQVTAGIEAGQCACDMRNPQGSCCLGNVRAVVQKIEAELRPQEAPR